MRLGRVFVVLGAAGLATLLFAMSPISRATVHAGCSASSPCPTPTPTNAFLTLDVSAGDSTTQITVNGGAFLANESMTLYWDSPSHVAGGANADSSGNFITKVKPFANDAPGVHRLCASVQPNPCANFTLGATATPSPTPTESPSPSADASPSPTSYATASPGSTPAAATLSGWDVFSRPPFLFLPLLGGLAILVALGYWVMTMVRRPTPLNLPATAVMHRATRPDYSAGVEAGPAPAPAPRAESAWADVLPVVPAPDLGPAGQPEPPAAASATVPGGAAPAEPAAPEPPSATPGPTPPADPEPPAPHSAGWTGPAGGWFAQPPSQPHGADEPPDLPEPGED